MFMILNRLSAVKAPAEYNDVIYFIIFRVNQKIYNKNRNLICSNNFILHQLWKKYEIYSIAAIFLLPFPFTIKYMFDGQYAVEKKGNDSYTITIPGNTDLMNVNI